MYGRYIRFASVAILGFALTAASVVHAQQGNASAERTGKQLFDAACATCHGTDGRGAPTVGFDIPLPDFTDCGFASREPDEDWLAVTHFGGPARAFDRMMPAYGDALTPAEMARIMGRVREFCRDEAWPRGELNLPRALVTEKAFPEDEAVWTGAFNAEGVGGVSQRLIYEKRWGPRNQFEFVVPFIAQERSPSNWIGGVGDLAFAFKRDLFHSLRTGSIFSVATEVVFPTGNADKGFGSGHMKFEPWVAFGQVLPSAGFLQFQGGFEIPSNRDRPDEVFFRTAIGKTFTPNLYGRTWTPMVEFLGSRNLVAGAPVSWDLLPQLQVSLSKRQHILLSGGVRIPATDSRNRSTQVVFYLLWDWFDGGLFSGW